MGTKVLLAALASVALLGAADPAGVVIEVDAGAHDRRGTIVEFPLPKALAGARDLAARSLDSDRPATGQLVPVPEPKVLLRLDEPLLAGAKRRFRLEPATPKEGQVAISGGLQKPRGIGGMTDSRTVATLSFDAKPVVTYHAAVIEPPAGIDRVYSRSGFIHPLTTRSGRVVTDDFPPEHPHQHGVFTAWVNTTFRGHHVDFWNQKEQTGRVGHDPDIIGPGINGGRLMAWFHDNLRHDDITKPDAPVKVLNETWDVRLYDVPGLVVVDLESRQKCAGPDPLTLNKYHYGGFGIRGARGWSDPEAKGEAPPDPVRSHHAEFLTSEGKHRADGNHTRPRWVDLSGEVEGGEVAGVVAFDHPSNFRFPQPVRLHPNMPYFSFSPPVLDEFQIKPGETYISRFRLIAHDGRPDVDQIERLWADYAEPPGVRVVAESD